MSYFTADQFARRHGGLQGLAKFVEWVRFGCPDCRRMRVRCRLAHIAREFKLSVSEISQLRSKLFVPDFVPVRGLTEYLEVRQRSDEELLKDRRAVIVELHRERRA